MLLGSERTVSLTDGLRVPATSSKHFEMAVLHGGGGLCSPSRAVTFTSCWPPAQDRLRPSGQGFSSFLQDPWPSVWAPHLPTGGLSPLHLGHNLESWD